MGGLLSIWDDERAHGDVFNLGGVGEISMNDLAARIVAFTGSSSEIVHIPYEEAYEPGFEDMQRRVPSTEKVRALTGWQPSRSLDDIIRDVADYQRSTGTK